MWNPFRKRKASQPTPVSHVPEIDTTCDMGFTHLFLEEGWPSDSLTITIRRTRRYKRPKGSTLERNGPNIRYIEIKGYTRGVIELLPTPDRSYQGILVPLDFHTCVRPGDLTRTLIGRYYIQPASAPIVMDT